MCSRVLKEEGKSLPAGFEKLHYADASIRGRMLVLKRSHDLIHLYYSGFEFPDERSVFFPVQAVSVYN
jgi:hypothetical protein